MIKSVLIPFFLTMVAFFSVGQISVESMEKEISNLKTQEEINLYLKELKRIDQEVLIYTKDIQKKDSISIENIIKTVLIFKIHGDSCYDRFNPLGILNMSHTSIAGVEVPYWTIIKKMSKQGGAIETIGGDFPAYELEGFGLGFYGYSLLYQDSIYDDIMSKIPETPIDSIIPEVLRLYEYEKEKRALSEISVVGQWNNQAFKNKKYREETCFEFVQMSDSSLYFNKNNQIQKLILLEVNSSSTKYKTEGEVFGWYFELFESGELFLKNTEGEILIDYLICD